MVESDADATAKTMLKTLEGVSEDKSWIKKIKVIMSDSDHTQIKANEIVAKTINPQDRPAIHKVKFHLYCLMKDIFTSVLYAYVQQP